MKTCSMCKQSKPFSKFQRNRNKHKDGYHSECKTCSKIYRQTEQGKIAQKRYEQSEKGKVALMRYRQSESGRNSRKASQKQFRMKHPERCKAGDVVKMAMCSGRLPRPTTLKCYYCPNKAQEYHHWSYLPEHQLDVIPVCVKCHTRVHRKSA